MDLQDSTEDRSAPQQDAGEIMATVGDSPSENSEHERPSVPTEEGTRCAGDKRKAASKMEQTAKRRKKIEFARLQKIRILQNRMFLPGQRPTNFVEEKLHEKGIEKKYHGKLRALRTGPLTSEEREKLRQIAKPTTNYVCRTASTEAGRHGGDLNIFSNASNGYTDTEIILPAVETNEDYRGYQRIEDLSRGDLIDMVGNHLMWLDLAGDGFMSYSLDIVMTLWHGLGRLHRGEEDAALGFYDRRRMERVDRELSPLFHALDLYDAVGVWDWEGWDARHRNDKLRPRKFTQELLSHGPVVITDKRFRPALISKLIADGLYKIFPEFEIPVGTKAGGLYGGQVYFRKCGYPAKLGPVYAKGLRLLYSYDDCAETEIMTPEKLATIQKVARNHMNIPADTDAESVEPHLHIFLQYLTLRKKAKGDPVIMEWIRQHYTAEDVTDLYCDGDGKALQGFTRVASNLPGFMQYLDLVRDAIEVFDLEEKLTDNDVEYENAASIHPYVKEDCKFERNEFPWTDYEVGKVKELREKRRVKRAEKKKIELALALEKEAEQKAAKEKAAEEEAELALSEDESLVEATISVVGPEEGNVGSEMGLSPSV